ncbi:alanine:cation symporter family protein, partial [Siminovitchia fortis]|uniref:alanine:cation symporter family protein n=1 Tax=Siminovitchia fortis TaxID=254758 RepID=UPI001642D364
EGDICDFQGVMRGMGGRVGVGKMVGVGRGVVVGGGGGVLWMWVGGFFGMGRKYGEGILGVK